MSDQSKQYLSHSWTKMRQTDAMKAKHKKFNRIMPVTIRSLESLIRLSTSFAKMRLSPSVDVSDCGNALLLYFHCYYGGYQNFDEQFFSDQIQK